MNIFSRTRNLVTVNLILACLAASTVHAQNITVQAQSIFVNGSSTPCPSATVTFGAGVININTAGCTGTVATSPTISSVTPSSGQPGTQVTISGANLAGAGVTIGGLAAVIASNTGRAITTSVPPTATAASVGGIVATVAGLTPATFAFTVQDPPPQAAPAIASVSPSTGTASTVVTITGTFLTGATVLIGGLDATVASNNGTVITTSVPRAATATSVGGVVVKVGTFAPATAAFTVLALPAPSNIAVTPTSGSAGTPITISGSGLAGASVTIGGIPANITTSSANSILTNIPVSAAPGTTNIVITNLNSTASASIAFAIIAASAECSDVSEDGVPLGCFSKRPSSVKAMGPKHAGQNGAGEEINAYSMGASRCLTTPALTKSWQHNIDIAEYKRNEVDFFLLRSGESLSYKFTAPIAPTSGGFSYGEAAQSGGSYPPVYMTITSAPCDFDTSKVAPGPTPNYCYQTGIAGHAMVWTSLSGLPESFCRLNPGSTYYFNLRFQDARPASEGGAPTRDACTSSPCGGILQVG